LKQSIALRRRFLTALIALLIALVAAMGATFAWYIYNTGAHTTNVRMAAGASVSLEISNDYDGPYASTTVLDSFVGMLDPVSTDKILNGFQKVTEFVDGAQGQPRRIASIFGSAEATDYYMTTLYLRTSGAETGVYLSDIGYEDSDELNPISTAIRIGFVVHDPGRNGAARSEYIFSISDEKNPEKEYNTATGEEGYVLDSTRTDGTTLPFTPYNSDNFCLYDTETGITTLQEDSLQLLTLPGGGESVQVDIYIWLEGCDEDCTKNLCSTTLRNVSLAFSAYQEA